MRCDEQVPGRAMVARTRRPVQGRCAPAQPVASPADRMRGQDVETVLPTKHGNLGKRRDVLGAHGQRLPGPGDMVPAISEVGY